MANAETARTSSDRAKRPGMVDILVETAGGPLVISRLARVRLARLQCYSARVIRTFADDVTKDIWNGVNSKAARRISPDVWPIVRRKLDQLDVVTTLDALKVPPGNRLHKLTGDLAGRYAIRINDQYRIVFRFEQQHAFDVRCTDYH